MPELAAIYFLGVFLGLVCTVLFVLHLRRRRKSLPYRTLQSNLRVINLFWSDHRDRLIAWEEDAEKTELEKSGRSMTIAGVLLSLLSWPGTFFFLIIIYSALVLARSRIEKRLFSSDLAKRPNLPEADVRKIIAELQLETEFSNRALMPR